MSNSLGCSSTSNGDPAISFKSIPFAILLSPALNAFLVSDAEEPTAEFPVIAQTADVPDGVDERLLDDIEAGLLVLDQLNNINV